MTPAGESATGLRGPRPSPRVSGLRSGDVRAAVDARDREASAGRRDQEAGLADAVPLDPRVRADRNDLGEQSVRGDLDVATGVGRGVGRGPADRGAGEQVVGTDGVLVEA